MADARIGLTQPAAFKSAAILYAIKTFFVTESLSQLRWGCSARSIRQAQILLALPMYVFGSLLLYIALFRT
jgi:hypothetical protein